MISSSKRLKNKQAVKNDDDTNKSLLPQNVQTILYKGMSEGFESDTLGLGFKNIHDSAMPEICEWIIKLGDKVKILDLSNNQITSGGASILLDTLRAINSAIKLIYLQNNSSIDDKCMKSLGEYIISNKSIEAIILNSTSISDTGIEILAPYLDGNTTFKQLQLIWNKGITDKSVPILIKMIESSCIEHVIIRDTSITQDSMVNLALVCNILRSGPAKFDLLYKNMNYDEFMKVFDAMKKYGIDKVKEINLERNKITSKVASALFHTLRECNSTVSILSLSCTQLDDECMKPIGEFIQDNEHLEELNLDYSFFTREYQNILTDKGVKILSEYLIGNTTLKRLNFFGNGGITEKSVPLMLEIAKRSYINYMNLDATMIGEEKKREINELLNIPIEQREIPIKSNTKSAAKMS